MVHLSSLGDSPVFHFPCPFTEITDNQSTQYIAANPPFHKLTKHREIDCHIVHIKLQSELLHLLPISSINETDILTKPLDPAQFRYLLTKQNVHKMNLSACWGVLSNTTDNII